MVDTPITATEVFVRQQELSARLDELQEVFVAEIEAMLSAGFEASLMVGAPDCPTCGDHGKFLTADGADECPDCATKGDKDE
jgi:hypothetical protein